MMVQKERRRKKGVRLLLEKVGRKGATFGRRVVVHMYAIEGVPLVRLPRKKWGKKNLGLVRKRYNKPSTDQADDGGYYQNAFKKNKSRHPYLGIE